MTPLKIDIVVPGRFHAFDLARAMLARGHDVVVYTNYPKSICKRWNLPTDRVRSYLRNGVMARICQQVARIPGADFEPSVHLNFGAWAARNVRGDADLVHVFSGVAEEVLRLPRDLWPGQRQLMRGSAHIREQHRLLAEEEERLGREVDKPSSWMIAREEREYELADRIVVLSSFAERSFLAHGVPQRRIIQVPLGVEIQHFVATSAAIEARCKRLLSGKPLQVLMVGTFSARKGALDLVEVAKVLSHKMHFRVVADVVPEVRQLAQQARAAISFEPRVPQFDLPEKYAPADLFVFPTIEDGYSVVLAQAQASGLPILATTNCSAPDLLTEGVNGWVLPIRDPAAVVARLEWCDRNRERVAAMVRGIRARDCLRDWTNVADDLTACARARFH